MSRLQRLNERARRFNNGPIGRVLNHPAISLAAIVVLIVVIAEATR